MFIKLCFMITYVLSHCPDVVEITFRKYNKDCICLVSTKSTSSVCMCDGTPLINCATRDPICDYNVPAAFVSAKGWFEDVRMEHYTTDPDFIRYVLACHS